MEKTLSIIKPDATKRNLTGAINSKIEGCGLRIVAQKRIKLTEDQAKLFYYEHKGRPFFQSLVDFMISGPVVVQVLEGENAVVKNREIMGATDPKNAEAGTIRAEFGDNVGENAVHGSDSPASAERELALFFDKNELVNS